MRTRETLSRIRLSWEILRVNPLPPGAGNADSVLNVVPERAYRPAR
jgi:hypothetical protein